MTMRADQKPKTSMRMPTTAPPMKMETVIPAPVSGKIERMTIVAGDKVDGDDLLVAIS